MAACSQSYELEGKITDKNAVAIPGATIHLLNTNLFAVTKNDGGFLIENIRPGHYLIEVNEIGYAKATKEIAITNANQFLELRLENNYLQLDDVIISAQKKEERLQTAPLSITSLNERQVKEYRLWTGKDITAIVPNLYAANPGDGRNVISIRGITSTSYDPAVTTYIDGVNQFSLDTYIPQLFDLESIEVLRGPQGTLYGRNAMGGVINITTKKPTNQTNAFAEVSMGNYGTQRFVGGIKTPVIKNKLFFGAAGIYEKLDGYYTNDFNQSNFDRQHSAGGNYYLKYLAGNKLSVSLNAKHIANRNYGSFPLVFNSSQAFSNPFHLNQNAITKLVDNVFNSSLVLNYAGPVLNVVSQTGYQSNYRYYHTPIDGDFAPIDGITIINNYGKEWNNVKVYTQEFRLSSPASSLSKLKWTAGSYLFYQHIPNKQAIHFGKDAAMVGSPNSDFAIINTTTGKNSGFAVYGKATYNITDNLTFSGGLRFDNQTNKLRVLGEYKPDGSSAPVFETQPDTASAVTHHALSPMVSIAYNANPSSNFYLTYSNGFRPGGLTQLSADPSQPPLFRYNPEYSNNIEFGIKNTLFENHLRANFAIFYTHISNAQVPTLILPDAITVTKNAGKLNSKGAEAEIAATFFKGLETTWNIGYTNAKYKNLKISQNGAAVNLAGKRQLFTPDFTSMLAIQYSVMVNKKQSIKTVLRGEWIYLGDQYFDLSNSIHQSPYSLFNVRAGITCKNFELMIWGRNLANKKYISYAYDFGAVHLGNPKTYGITAGIKI